jgi:hypothetical protein
VFVWIERMRGLPCQTQATIRFALARIGGQSQIEERCCLTDRFSQISLAFNASLRPFAPLFEKRTRLALERATQVEAFAVQVP